MRWRVVKRLHFLLMQGDPARPLGIPTRTRRGATLVPVWVCDLWAACKDERPEWPDGAHMSFGYRFEKALPVVGEPGGVDPTAFSAALRLGGWEAARNLHSQLHPTVPAYFPISLTK